MIASILENVNVKRLFLTVLAVFAFVFVSDFVIHHILLGPTYRDTSSLWRSEGEMKGYMIWMLIGQFLTAAFFSVIFAKGYEGKGLGEGVRYGLLIGPFAIAPHFIQYAVTPLPQFLLWSWIAGTMVQAILGGVIAAAVYRR